jgi:hypothetical protein
MTQNELRTETEQQTRSDALNRYLINLEEENAKLKSEKHLLLTALIATILTAAMQILI